MRTPCAAPATANIPEDDINRQNGYDHRDFDTRAGTRDIACPGSLSARTAWAYPLGDSPRRSEELVDFPWHTSLSNRTCS